MVKLNSYFDQIKTQRFHDSKLIRTRKCIPKFGTFSLQNVGGQNLHPNGTAKAAPIGRKCKCPTPCVVRSGLRSQKMTSCLICVFEARKKSDNVKESLKKNWISWKRANHSVQYSHLKWSQSRSPEVSARKWQKIVLKAQDITRMFDPPPFLLANCATQKLPWH